MSTYRSRASLLAALLFLCSACTITQRARPVSMLTGQPRELCVIEDPAVNATFLPALTGALERKGFVVRKLAAGGDVSSCPLTARYYARWSWDFVTYMSHATITVYRNGEQVGDALYDAPKAGSSMTTRIYEPTESKVATMVEQLFPGAA